MSIDGDGIDETRVHRHTQKPDRGSAIAPVLCCFVLMLDIRSV